jgi:hypothetical protein
VESGGVVIDTYVLILITNFKNGECKRKECVMKTKQSLIGMVAVCFAAMVFAVDGFGAVPGDVNGSGNVDLHDVVLAIQVCAGMNPIRIRLMV